MTYAIKTAIGGMWREKWINILSSITMAVGLFVISVCALLVYNLDMASKKLHERFSMAVFLKDGLASEQERDLHSRVKAMNQVRDVRYISKDEALKDLKSSLKNPDDVLEGLSGNPLPASLEIKLNRDAVNSRSVNALASEIKKLQGVDEVHYGAEELSVMESFKQYIESVGAAFIAALAAGLVFVCYSTVKILFYRKAEEIETLKLLGATKWFIRSPFLIEGAALGLISGALCSTGLLILYYAALARLSAQYPILKLITAPVETFYMPPAAGLIIGAIGALIAVGRVRFTP